MTMRGTARTPMATRRIIAALVQLHHMTHPERVARDFGFSAQYVRKLWREIHPDDLPHLQVALDAMTKSTPSTFTQEQAHG